MEAAWMSFVTKIKFLELIWKPGPCTDQIFTLLSVDLHLKPAICAGSGEILGKKPGIQKCCEGYLEGRKSRICRGKST